MVLDKTGGLFRMAVGLMQAFTEDKRSQKDFTRLLNKLSLYFQIRDDYLNVDRWDDGFSLQKYRRVYHIYKRSVLKISALIIS